MPVSVMSVHCLPASVYAPIGPAWFQFLVVPAAHAAGPATCACCIAVSPRHMDVTVRLHSEFGHMAPQCIMPPAARPTCS